MIRTAARTAVRVSAVAVIAFSAMGLAGTAFADEDTTGGGASTTTETASTTTAGVPEACSLLSEDLAQKTINERTDLVLTSTSGGAECLYQAADGSGSYAVDLDVSEHSAGSLAQAREGWSQPGVDIADVSGLGEGAFTGLNHDLDAVVVCAKDGVQFDIEVWAPEGSFAKQQVLTLAKRYCTPDTAAAAPAAGTTDAGADATEATDAGAPAADATADTDTEGDAETADA